MPSVTSAIDGSDDIHVIVLSVALAGDTVAVRVIVVPVSITIFASFSDTPVTGITGSLTVTIHIAVLPFDVVTVIAAVPAFFAFTMPPDTVATVVSDDAQVTVLSVALLGDIVAVSVDVFPISSVSAVLLRDSRSQGSQDP